MVHPTPVYRIFTFHPYFNPNIETRSLLPAAKMSLGPRILRSVIMVGLVLLLGVIVFTSILYPRGQCLASLDMGQEPIEVDELQVDVKEKVDLYATLPVYYYYFYDGLWFIVCFF